MSIIGQSQVTEARNNTKVRLAATVVLLRDSTTGPEVFMVKRPRRGDFPDLHVFPGGKVDAEDQLDERFCLGLTDRIASRQLRVKSGGLRYWVAAIRECFEEAGVLLACRDGQGLVFEDREETQRFSRYRDALIAGDVTFSHLVTTESVSLRTNNVHFFSHWITPEGAPARFNTRFFVASMPSNQHAIGHHVETAGGVWINPEQAIRNEAKGDWQMIVPTLTTLRMISSYESVGELVDTVKTGKHQIPVTPLMHQRGMQYVPDLWCTD